MLLFTFTVKADAKYYHENTENVYVHKSTQQKQIALTFDDGPHPQKTNMILDVLSRYDIKATFFVIGENAKNNPDIISRISEDGHEIGNHTYDHKSLYKQSESDIISNVRKCEDEIYKVTGKRTVLFRPPEGYLNDNIASLLLTEGYDVILWRVDTYDWKGKSADDIATNVIKNVKCGDIVLMHDYIWRKSNTAQALDLIIPQLLSDGYEFVTVSELIEAK